MRPHSRDQVVIPKSRYMNKPPEAFTGIKRVDSAHSLHLQSWNVLESNLDRPGTNKQQNLCLHHMEIQCDCRM